MAGYPGFLIAGILGNGLTFRRGPWQLASLLVEIETALPLAVVLSNFVSGVFTTHWLSVIVHWSGALLYLGVISVFPKASCAGVCSGLRRVTPACQCTRVHCLEARVHRNELVCPQVGR